MILCDLASKFLSSVVVIVMLVALINASPTSVISKRNGMSDSKSQLPYCRSGSSCGYIQLNGRGMSVQETCRCPQPGQDCPLFWDPFDGQTIVHGNDHYKYCDQAPQLEPCKKGQVAYTSRQELSLITMEFLVMDHRMHCICPGNYLLQQNRSDTIQRVEGDITSISTSHICVPPPRCARKQSCMTITESAESSFITRSCRCPRGSYCPHDLRLASRRETTNRGAFFLMECL